MAIRSNKLSDVCWNPISRTYAWWFGRRGRFGIIAFSSQSWRWFCSQSKSVVNVLAFCSMFQRILIQHVVRQSCCDCYRFGIFILGIWTMLLLQSHDPTRFQNGWSYFNWVNQAIIFGSINVACWIRCFFVGAVGVSCSRANLSPYHLFETPASQVVWRAKLSGASSVLGGRQQQGHKWRQCD